MAVVMSDDVDNIWCTSQSIKFGKGYPKGFMAIIDSLEVHREKLFEFYFQRFQFWSVVWNSLDELNGRKSFLCHSGKIEDEVCGRGGQNCGGEKEDFFKHEMQLSF